MDQSRQTESEGIFACGNVLHVHDLVDYVSEEAAIAGRAAVAYLKKEKRPAVSVCLATDGKVRYTVPTRITKQEDVTVYFRVADVYRNACLTVSLDGEELIKKKKPKLAPGEMETVTIPVSVIKRADGKTLTLAIKQ